MQPQAILARLDSQSHLDRCVIARYWQHVMFSDQNGDLSNPQLDRAVFLWGAVERALFNLPLDNEMAWESWWEEHRQPHFDKITFSQLLCLHRAGPGLSEMIRTKREFQKKGEIKTLSFNLAGGPTAKIWGSADSEEGLVVTESSEFGSPEFFETLFRGTIEPPDSARQRIALDTLTTSLIELRSKVSALKELSRYPSFTSIGLAEISADLRRLSKTTNAALPQHIKPAFWPKHVESAIKSIYLQLHRGWSSYRAAGASSDTEKALEGAIASIKTRPWFKEFSAPDWNPQVNGPHLMTQYFLLISPEEYKAKILGEIKSLSREFADHKKAPKVKGEI